MKAAVIPIAETSAAPKASAIFSQAALRQNVVTVHLLALCPMLAVSVSAAAAAALGFLTTLVMTVTAALVAVLRHNVPDAVRLPVLLILVAAAVAVLDLLLAARLPALHRELGIFLPLIITNCAVLARLEVFARRQPPLAAAIDGAASGIGMTAALLALALVRELLGNGALPSLAFLGLGGAPWLPFFDGVPLALLPAGGFILFGLLLAWQNAMKNR